MLAGSLYSQQQEGDRIIAIIGNEVILESDLNYQLMLYARQNNGNTKGSVNTIK